MEQKHIWYQKSQKIGLEQKNVRGFLYKVFYFKLYVTTASVINRFEETTALKCSDQRRQDHVAVFKSNI